MYEIRISTCKEDKDQSLSPKDLNQFKHLFELILSKSKGKRERAQGLGRGEVLCEISHANI